MFDFLFGSSKSEPKTEEAATTVPSLHDAIQVSIAENELEQEEVADVDEPAPEEPKSEEPKKGMFDFLFGSSKRDTKTEEVATTAPAEETPIQDAIEETVVENELDEEEHEAAEEA